MTQKFRAALEAVAKPAQSYDGESMAGLADLFELRRIIEASAQLECLLSH